jgi:hypothetical protein
VRYVVILGLVLASLSGCSDEDDEKGFESSPVGPAISIECAQTTPRQPTVGDTEIDVVCERANVEAR